ncbi:hypothetical protein N431DRAFT_450935 [Stipitochalara longipes BDJ]|nr:hypothetical protein N431DRAFT_450935 [Stipitochalara longipes BDJ]
MPSRPTKSVPLICPTFAGYLSRKDLKNVNTLTHKAMQYTDVNAIASDGWYHLARKEHYGDHYETAADYYRRADEARGEADCGYLPAKFGAAQPSVLKNDFGEARHFICRGSVQFKKAVGYLENVRTAWKDSKKDLVPDVSVLLNLARLFEVDQPEKSLQCLQQVEQLEFDHIPEERPKKTEDETAFTQELRKNLPPQLLNNIGCFYY